LDQAKAFGGDEPDSFSRQQGHRVKVDWDFQGASHHRLEAKAKAIRKAGLCIPQATSLRIHERLLLA
jgi:hypothetical protein